MGRECHTWEVNGAIVVCINFVDHVLKLRFGRVLSEGAHDGAQFSGSDLSYPSSIQYQPFVYQIEKYCDLFRDPRNVGINRLESRPGVNSTDHRHLYPVIMDLVSTFSKTTRSHSMGRVRSTYEKRESLLVLRDLLFGQRIGLLFTITMSVQLHLATSCLTPRSGVVYTAHGKGEEDKDE